MPRLRESICCAEASSFFLVALLLMVIGACCGTATKMYEGPTLPKEQLAILYRTENAGIAAVDGKWPGMVFTTTPIHLLPGEHSVQVNFSKPSDYSASRYYSVKPIEVKFNALAGHEYEVLARLTGPISWSAVIQERATQARVDSPSAATTHATVPDDVSTEQVTVIKEPAEVWKDARIEIRLDKTDRTNTYPSEVKDSHDKPFAPRQGNDFFVIYAIVSRIKGVHVRHLGARGHEKSALHDESGNSFKQDSWHVQGVSFFGGSLNGPSEFIEGSKITLIFEVPQDVKPAYLSFVYYYTNDWKEESRKAKIEVKLPGP